MFFFVIATCIKYLQQRQLLPFADLRRVVVGHKRKYVHEVHVLVNC